MNYPNFTCHTLPAVNADSPHRKRLNITSQRKAIESFNGFSTLRAATSSLVTAPSAPHCSEALSSSAHSSPALDRIRCLLPCPAIGNAKH